MTNITLSFDSISRRSLVFLTVLSLLVISCKNKGDDPKPPGTEPTTESLVGDYYAIESATLKAAVSGYDSLTEGRDISELVYKTFQTLQRCNSQNNLLFSFRANDELYITCDSSTQETRVATWSLSKDSSTLVAIMSTSLFPLQLTFTSVDLTDSMRLSGNVENFPIFENTIDPSASSLSLLRINVDIVFGKKAYFRSTSGDKSDSTGINYTPVTVDYQFSEAVLAADVPGYDSLTAGTDISSVFYSLFARLRPCSDSGDSSRMFLRKDNKIYLSCGNENNESESGTWGQEASRSNLVTVNFSTPAIPGGLVSISLENEVDVNENTLSGRGFVPLPKLFLDPQSSEPLDLVRLDVRFTFSKVPE